MTTSVMTIDNPWMNMVLESLSLGILGNPFTYRLFSKPSSNAIAIVYAVPVDYPATFDSHISEEIETPNEVVTLCFVVVG